MTCRCFTWAVQAGGLLNESDEGQHACTPVQLIILVEQGILFCMQALLGFQIFLHIKFAIMRSHRMMQVTQGRHIHTFLRGCKAEPDDLQFILPNTRI